jgi:RNA polymerase sigma-70 factor (ECF subfamily)
MRLRQARRAKFLYLDDVVIGEDSTTLELPSETATPEMELGLEEVSQVLEQEIKRIPPLLRNVFVLRDVRELPMPEVAKKLGISVAAAKSRLLRARQELRTRMSRHEGRYGPATLLA